MIVSRSLAETVPQRLHVAFPPTHRRIHHNGQHKDKPGLAEGSGDVEDIIDVPAGGMDMVPGLKIWPAKTSQPRAFSSSARREGW